MPTKRWERRKVQSWRGPLSRGQNLLARKPASRSALEPFFHLLSCATPQLLIGVCAVVVLASRRPYPQTLAHSEQRRHRRGCGHLSHLGDPWVHHDRGVRASNKCVGRSPVHSSPPLPTYASRDKGNHRKIFASSVLHHGIYN